MILNSCDIFYLRVYNETTEFIMGDFDLFAPYMCIVPGATIDFENGIHGRVITASFRAFEDGKISGVCVLEKKKGRSQCV
jgi:hypothetical protein